ncbi:hypothetical protein J2T18_004631 [Paenibacillus polymyxa]|uniref:hypothetical protein n=1 Tax=Paenibacillus polymyxa TaxID=1406 RepID=UPI00279103E1|nr:hypothetical protein [Paenibacillus polymyxa]MDQ0050303.1 hypothetical protein [Paenibacillus polymyxa]
MVPLKVAILSEQVRVPSQGQELVPITELDTDTINVGLLHTFARSDTYAGISPITSKVPALISNNLSINFALVTETTPS